MLKEQLIQTVLIFWWKNNLHTLSSVWFVIFLLWPTLHYSSLKPFENCTDVLVIRRQTLFTILLLKVTITYLLTLSLACSSFYCVFVSLCEISKSVTCEITFYYINSEQCETMLLKCVPINVGRSKIELMPGKGTFFALLLLFVFLFLFYFLFTALMTPRSFEAYAHSITLSYSNHIKFDYYKFTLV